MIAKQKCDDQIWMTGREIFARDNRSTIDLNLMWNQSTCLNASIALSGLPIIMQTQIRATNTRWGGRTLKSSQREWLFIDVILSPRIHISLVKLLQLTFSE
jgi:hypothetical protein